GAKLGGGVLPVPPEEPSARALRVHGIGGGRAVAERFHADLLEPVAGPRGGDEGRGNGRVVDGRQFDAPPEPEREEGRGAVDGQRVRAARRGRRVRPDRG